MNIKQSKALENAIIRGIFASQQADCGNPADRAFLFLLENGNCHASYILEKLTGDDLGALIADMRRCIADGGKPSEDYYDTLLESLEKICVQTTDYTPDPEDMTINSGHMLLYMIRAEGSVACKLLGIYGIDYDEVSEMVSELPSDEDYYVEMNALRNIRFFRNKPQEANRRTPATESVTAGTGTPDIPGRSGDEDTRSFLSLYCTDLTAEAMAGKSDPVIGREEETEAVIQTLGRRKKNHPLLVGEAGVGKSAIVEGLAQRIAEGNVPPFLRGKRILSLDVASLVAGTIYRGQFEERMRGFLNELETATDAILFIDEIHIIMGAGATHNGLDAAAILKPALTGSSIMCIGATTLDEYRRYIRTDSALERRFRRIDVSPATPNQTIDILNNIKERYERHHSVRYTDAAIEACVKLTDVYFPGRNFPDKAIDVMDEAGSKTYMECTASNHIRHTATAVAEKEQYRRPDAENKASCNTANDKQSATADTTTGPCTVTAEEVRATVSSMTGIPERDIKLCDTQENIRRMLQETVAGQHEAIRTVSRAIQRTGCGLYDPGRPKAVLLFAGPAGTGKRKLATELARLLFARPDAIVRIDMEEFRDKASASRLAGTTSRDGACGGILTETAAAHPNSVILLDGLHRAHPEALAALGRTLYDDAAADNDDANCLSESIIIMTLDTGAVHKLHRPIGYNGSAGKDETYAIPDAGEYLPEELATAIDEIVPFMPLSAKDIRRIVEMEFARLGNKAETLGYTLRLSENACRILSDTGMKPGYGVHKLKRLMHECIEKPLAEMIADGKITPGDEICVAAMPSGVRPIKRHTLEKHASA